MRAPPGAVLMREEVQLNRVLGVHAGFSLGFGLGVYLPASAPTQFKYLKNKNILNRAPPCSWIAERSFPNAILP
jgi:hypothetical protein